MSSFLYTANRCVTQTRLRVCLVHNSMAFANQQGLYACVNVISIFHGSLTATMVAYLHAILSIQSIMLHSKKNKRQALKQIFPLVAKACVDQRWLIVY